MRLRVVAAIWLLGMVVGCDQTNPGPALTISPSGTSGTVQITRSTEFTAVLLNSTAEVTWSVEGEGSSFTLLVPAASARDNGRPASAAKQLPASRPQAEGAAL